MACRYPSIISGCCFLSSSAVCVTSQLYVHPFRTSVLALSSKRQRFFFPFPTRKSEVVSSSPVWCMTFDRKKTLCNRIWPLTPQLAHCRKTVKEAGGGQLWSQTPSVCTLFAVTLLLASELSPVCVVAGVTSSAEFFSEPRNNGSLRVFTGGGEKISMLIRESRHIRRRFNWRRMYLNFQRMSQQIFLRQKFTAEKKFRLDRDYVS